MPRTPLVLLICWGVTAAAAARTGTEDADRVGQYIAAVAARQNAVVTEALARIEDPGRQPARRARFKAHGLPKCSVTAAAIGVRSRLDLLAAVDLRIRIRAALRIVVLGDAFFAIDLGQG